MAEIEISAIIRQCLDRRIGDKETITREVLACVRGRNETGATVRWMFSLDDSRAKPLRAYPRLNPSESL